MPKRAPAMAFAIATATSRVVGDKKGDGAGNEKGDGDGNKEGNGKIDGDNTGNGHRKEGGGRLMAARMGTAQRTRRKGHSCSRYDWREGDDGGDGPWFVCVFWCAWRDHKKIRKRVKSRPHPCPGVAIRRIFDFW
jgi:hypothetical protein